MPSADILSQKLTPSSVLTDALNTYRDRLESPVMAYRNLTGEAEVAARINAAARTVWNDYKFRHKKKHGGTERNFIPFWDFKAMLFQPCHYCGKPPEIPLKQKLRNRSIHVGYRSSVDRIDNSIGYTKDNCVACCGLCNRMKSDLTPEEFIAHTRAIADYKDRIPNNAEAMDIRPGCNA